MIVYIAVNKSNGKRYIGATKHSLSHRKRGHWSDANGRNYCRKFGSALRKYGPDGFEWRVLATCSSLQEMATEEMRLIAEMKPEYNITLGGQGIFGVPYTDERRAKLSKSLTGRRMKPAQRSKNAELLAQLRVKRHRSVVCLDDGKMYASCKEASEFYGVTHSNIRSVAEGGQATPSTGYLFNFQKCR